MGPPRIPARAHPVPVEQQPELEDLGDGEQQLELTAALSRREPCNVRPGCRTRDRHGCPVELATAPAPVHQSWS